MSGQFFMDIFQSISYSARGFLYQIVVNKFHILNEFLYTNQTTKNITLDIKYFLTQVSALFKSSSVSSAISIAVCESTFGSKVTKSIFLFM
jgi:hypothetical protein